MLDHTKNGDRLGVPLCDPVMKTLEAVKPSRPYATRASVPATQRGAGHR